MDKIVDFVKLLNEQKVNSQSLNIYLDKDFSSNKTNLSIYLTQMKILKPKILFLGEAPGHKGCKLTGIPFTSEYILSKVNKFNLFGFSNKYIFPEKPQKEATSTMIWEVLEKYSICPLLWNAYPFYPFNEKINESNRTPNSEELRIGEIFILKLIEIFEITKFISVGKNAEKSILRLNLNPFSIPHPSHGNKRKFENKVAKFITL